MEKEFKEKGIVTFNGLTIAPSNAVTLKLKLRYDELITSVQLLQGMNSDITLHAKLNNKKAMNLGLFTIGGVNFDKDGNALIPFKSLVQNVNLNNIMEIVDEEYIQMRFLAVLELPDSELDKSEEQSEDWDEEESDEDWEE